MQINSRVSLPVLVGSLSLLLASTAIAEERGRAGARHPSATQAVGDRSVRSETGGMEDRAGAVSESPEAGNRARNADGRRGCRRGARPQAGVACDYYYDDDSDDEYADDGAASQGAGNAAAPRPTQAPAGAAARPAPAAAKMAPANEEFEAVESFTPHAGATLREELIAARRNWMAKKSHLDAVSQQLADAEFKAYKTGSSVDPALAERRKQARAEVAEAHAAMGPLVERAREAGIAPGVIKLYEEGGAPE